MQYLGFWRTCVCLFLVQNLAAQSFIPGQSYYGANGYIEYIAGNAPIVLSAPHGGYLTPDTIPDRECTGCVYVRDGNTQELSRAAAKALFERTGCYPHVIINRLHRKKLDANREIIEAADSNALAEQAWYDFHTFMDSAQAAVKRDFGRGLYMDVHGHGHTIQRLELGYLLSATELQASDAQLQTSFYLNQSSIKQLVNNNLGSQGHAELLRGPHSIGTYFAQRGYSAVPSEDDPYPDDGEPYFNGGYNTVRYGSHNSSSPLDAIQIECNSAGVRDNLDNVARFADTMAVALVTYVGQHYFAQTASTWCQPNSSVGGQLSADVRISPNPFVDQLKVKTGQAGAYHLHVFALDGRLLHRFEGDGPEFDVQLPQDLPAGSYLMLLENRVGERFYKMMQRGW